MANSILTSKTPSLFKNAPFLTKCAPENKNSLPKIGEQSGVFPSLLSPPARYFEVVCPLPGRGEGSPPRVSPPRHLVVIRAVRGPYRHDPMVSRHVVAHELGHVLGLEHNAESHTLMCGPCQPLTAEPDETGFLPLTEGDRTRLLELYGES